MKPFLLLLLLGFSSAGYAKGNQAAKPPAMDGSFFNTAPPPTATEAPTPSHLTSSSSEEAASVVHVGRVPASTRWEVPNESKEPDQVVRVRNIHRNWN
jgi:hypothetical protein